MPQSSRVDKNNSGLDTAKRYIVNIDEDQFNVFIDSESEELVIVQSAGRSHKYRITRRENPFEVIVSEGYKKQAVSIDNSEGKLAVYLGCREGTVTVKTERDLLYEKYQTSIAKDEQDVKIISPLPGLVTKIQVKPGAQLHKNDGIVVIEAMKMENEIRAPRDCTVLEINVEEGTTIDKGAVIAVLT
ncbi:acetyl-CoA carboxylase biotin carboxyl carrier protein subunit [candidate division KSB1 bacterium]